MYFGIGFLLAALIALAVIPLVHNRAVRLTVRRLEAALPQSMLEVQADKDQLRAEFAMSTRRLEIKVEQLKNRIASQLVELGKKDAAINRFKIERNGREEAKAEGDVIPVLPWPIAERVKLPKDGAEARPVAKRATRLRRRRAKSRGGASRRR